MLIKDMNYVSCHDNYTLFDQLNWNLKKSTTQPADLTTVARASVAVNGMVLMSNGISFINGGEELFRTKLERSLNHTVKYAKMENNNHLLELCNGIIYKLQYISDQSNQTSDGCLKSFIVLKQDILAVKAELNSLAA